ncbi:tRNA adenosine deaminase-associated protein [Jatrophihabitans sp.]|uniref:tRNA adenosine deaminase-associated protein n=1 Tax=Jatrophihabitans sp. TaxID=1932789 RepID=UPI002B92A731|nr:tRNA adenosine deaminase-associated protein [Jatrophihabitans sp.]
MSYVALALLGKGRARPGWLLEEVDLDGCESIDDVSDVLRDFDQPVRLLAVEQDDEYAVLARLDAAADQAAEPIRVFLSNGHAADDYPLAQLFADGLDEVGGDPLDGDEDAPAGAHDAAPFGDPQLLADLGMPATELIELAVHEGTLPADLIETVCERLGCLGEFEALRG